MTNTSRTLFSCFYCLLLFILTLTPSTLVAEQEVYLVSEKGLAFIQKMRGQIAEGKKTPEQIQNLANIIRRDNTNFIRITPEIAQRELGIRWIEPPLPQTDFIREARNRYGNNQVRSALQHYFPPLLIANMGETGYVLLNGWETISNERVLTGYPLDAGRPDGIGRFAPYLPNQESLARYHLNNESIEYFEDVVTENTKLTGYTNMPRTGFIEAIRDIAPFEPIGYDDLGQLNREIAPNLFDLRTSTIIPTEQYHVQDRVLYILNNQQRNPDLHSATLTTVSIDNFSTVLKLLIKNTTGNTTLFQSQDRLRPPVLVVNTTELIQQIVNNPRMPVIRIQAQARFGVSIAQELANLRQRDRNNTPRNLVIVDEKDKTKTLSLPINNALLTMMRPLGNNILFSTSEGNGAVVHNTAMFLPFEPQDPNLYLPGVITGAGDTLGSTLPPALAQEVETSLSALFSRAGALLSTERYSPH